MGDGSVDGRIFGFALGLALCVIDLCVSGVLLRLPSSLFRVDADVVFQIGAEVVPLLVLGFHLDCQVLLLDDDTHALFSFQRGFVDEREAFGQDVEFAGADVEDTDRVTFASAEVYLPFGSPRGSWTWFDPIKVAGLE